MNNGKHFDNLSQSGEQVMNGFRRPGFSSWMVAIIRCAPGLSLMQAQGSGDRYGIKEK
jgi:hypothetical protein